MVPDLLTAGSSTDQQCSTNTLGTTRTFGAKPCRGLEWELKARNASPSECRKTSSVRKDTYAIL